MADAAEPLFLLKREPLKTLIGIVVSEAIDKFVNLNYTNINVLE